MKISQIETKNDKNPKISNFQSFYAIVVNISTDFVNWIAANGHQSTTLLSSSVL